MKVLALSNSDTEDGNGRFSLLTKAEIAEMSEVNYRRNGMKYSTTGKCWGVAPKAGGGHGVTVLPGVPKGTARPKSSRERRAMNKGK